MDEGRDSEVEQYYDNYKRQLSLLLDRNRTLKYKYAIFQAVKPGDLVIDFGCGTGILGFFALQAGARHIYAIEETPIIEYAEKLAIKNNFDDKITFIQKAGKQITEQEIPEKADLLVSEPISNLLLEGDAWSSIEYLKNFLKKDGLILPVSGTLFIVPVNSPPENFIDSDVLIGGQNVYNIDFLDLPRTVFYKSTLKRDSWLAKPQPLLELNLKADTLLDTFQNSVKFSIHQSGQLYGVEFFFEVRIFENIRISSKDQVEYPSWMPLFAPCSYQTFVCPEDVVRITVWNRILGPYKCSWTLEFIHHSKLLSSEDKWWKTDSAIPILAPGVIQSQRGLIRLKHDEYYQYDCDNELELDFLQLLPKSLSCSEICQVISQSQNYNLTHEKIMENLVKLLHKLLINSMIQLPIPYERFQVTNFQSSINIP